MPTSRSTAQRSTSSSTESRPNLGAAAIVIAAVILASAIVYASHRMTDAAARIEAAADRLDNRLQRGRSKPVVPATATARSSAKPAQTAPPSVPAAESSLTQADFSKVWRAEPRERAEKACFGPVDARGEPIETSPYFHVTVDPDGLVTAVAPIRDDIMTELYDCVGAIIRTLKLEGTGVERVGLVQAERPPPTP